MAWIGNRPVPFLDGEDRIRALREHAIELLGEPRYEPCLGFGGGRPAGGQGLTPDLAELMIQAFNERFCRPPLPAAEIARIIGEVAAHELQRLRSGEEFEPGSQRHKDRPEGGWADEARQRSS